MCNNVFPKTMQLGDNVKKFGRARHATDDII
jgi:hypothetical protein